MACNVSVSIYAGCNFLYISPSVGLPALTCLPTFVHMYSMRPWKCACVRAYVYAFVHMCIHSGWLVIIGWSLGGGLVSRYVGVYVSTVVRRDL